MNSSASVHSHLLSPWNLKTQSKVPKSFIWDLDDDLSQPKEKLNTAVIDLKGFFNEDKSSIEQASQLIRVASQEHGCFQVVNHGVDPKLLNEAYDHIDDFFKLGIDVKLKALKKPGKVWGFLQAHAHRFSSNLPWKETLSFPYTVNDSNPTVLDYFNSVLGSDLEPMGRVYQKYCEAMHGLSMSIIELLAISLGVEKDYYVDMFKEGSSIMRCNYYPPCVEPGQVLGTGPHCDPPGLTILYQDQVGGLQVFANHKWQTVEPRPDALVVNIGDTFMALTNGKYKSCLHRAVVNESKERKSMAFFLCPRNDQLLRPPKILSNPRMYPDFTWSQFLYFVQNHYRSDEYTLQRFTHWFEALRT